MILILPVYTYEDFLNGLTCSEHMVNVIVDAVVAAVSGDVLTVAANISWL